MGKSKKNIADFQKALLSKAQFITADAEPEKKTVPPAIQSSQELSKEAVPLVIASTGWSIDDEISAKFKLLAGETGREYNELVRHALTHYLMLKGLRLRDALNAGNKKDTSIRQL